ncbi:MAG: type IV pilus modification protein PilV [Pseudomonadota bacterium]
MRTATSHPQSFGRIPRARSRGGIHQVSKRRQRFVRPGRAAGFTLIEVMVSVLILLVGLLGVVGMQMLSLQANQGAYFRSQAIYIGSEILDAIRANPQAAADYEGNYPADIPADPGCQGVDGCTPAMAAQQDLHFWGRHFMDAGNLVADNGGTYRSAIPDGRAVITRTAATNEVSVRVTWTERQFDNTDAADGSATRSAVEQAVDLTSVITP